MSLDLESVFGTSRAPQAPALDLETVFGGGGAAQPPSEDAMLRLIARTAQRFGVPIEVALAIWHAEGGRRDPNVRGSSGEVGPFQVMPETFRGIMGSGADPSNLDQNVEAGIRYLRQNYDRFKSWPLAAAAYNAGGGAVAAGKIPSSTKNTYVPRFLELWDTFRKDPGHAVKRVVEELGHVGPQAALSGLTLGYVPMPKTEGRAQQAAGMIGETVGAVAPFLVGGAGAGAIGLRGALRTAGAMGAMGAGRAGIAAAKGEAPISEIPIEAAREAAIGLTGDIVLRLAAAPILSLARRLGILPQRLAEDVADAGNRTARPGETQEQAVKRVMANLASGLHTPEGTGRAPLWPTSRRPPETAPLFTQRPSGGPPEPPRPPTEPPGAPVEPSAAQVGLELPTPPEEPLGEPIVGAPETSIEPPAALAPELPAASPEPGWPTNPTLGRAIIMARRFGIEEEILGSQEPSSVLAQRLRGKVPGSIDVEAIVRGVREARRVPEPEPPAPPPLVKPTPLPHPAVPPAKKAGDVPATVGALDTPKNPVSKLRAQLRAQAGSDARLQAERVINAARQALVDAKGSPPEAVQAFQEAITGEVPFNMLDDAGAQSVVLAVRRGGLTFRQASSHVAGPSPLILTAEELAQRASTEMPTAIATQIDLMARSAEAAMLKSEDLVDKAVARRSELHPRTGVVKQRQSAAGDVANGVLLTIRDHEYMAEQARQHAAQMREQIRLVREQGVELPPLEPLATPQQFQETLRVADPARLEQLRGEIERASLVVQDANNRIADLTGGVAVSPEHATGAAHRYLVMLAKQTRDLGEMARLLEKREVQAPEGFLEQIRRALGTQHLGIVPPGTQEFIALMDRTGVSRTFQAIGLWTKALFYPMRAVIEQVPAGRDFIEAALNGAERDEGQGLGRLVAPFEQFRRLPRAEQMNVMRVVENRAAPLNARAAAMAHFWKQYFAATDKELAAAQWTTFDPERMAQIDEIRELRRQNPNIPFPEEGPYRPYHGRANFWPHSMKRELLDSRAHDASMRARLVRHYQALGHNDATAEALANNDMTSIRRQRGVRYGHIEMARTADLPEFMRESPDRELVRYITQVEHAKAMANHFGNHEVTYQRLTGESSRTWTGAELYFQRIGREAADQGLDQTARQMAERVFRIYAREGALDDLDQRLKGAANVINQLAVIANMSLSTIWKITQPFTNAPLRTSFRAFAEGLLDVMRPGGIAAQRESGAIIDDVFHDVIAENEFALGPRTWARRYLTLNGFIPAVRWSRSVAAASGKRYARHLFNRLNHNRGDAFARRQLESMLGPRLRDALDRGALTVQDYNDAGFVIARDVEFIGRSDRYPEFWSSPWGQFASLFHRFTYQQGQFILKHVVGEARQGNLTPLLALIPAWFVVGDAAQTLMSQFRGKKRPFMLGELYDWLVLGHAPEESTTQMLQHFVDSTVGWAAMGIWRDLWNSMGSTERLLESVTGPVMSETARLAVHGGKALLEELQVRNLERPADRRTAADAFLRDLTRHIPIVGSRMADEIRTPHELYLRTRKAALDAYDQGDLGAFMDLQGQLMDLGKPLSVADLSKREREKLMKQMQRDLGQPTYRAVPGEAEYAPAR